jgi:hypothetical protein
MPMVARTPPDFALPLHAGARYRGRALADLSAPTVALTSD